MRYIYNYIGGEWTKTAKEEWLELYNPATGEVYAYAPASTPTEVEDAVTAAEKAFPLWAQTPAQARADILLAIAEGIHRRFDEFALAETTDNGKPLGLSKRMDIPRAIENFKFFAHAITQFHSETFEMANGLNYVLRKPLGVVGVISPWNLPLYLFTWKVAPAIASGNTVVAKPSEITPMTAYLLSEVCHEAGLPPGVLNMVHGKGAEAGEPIVTHPKVKAISFTGSTTVKRRIAQLAAPVFKKVSLEMGGKNPTILFADADYEKALETTVRSSFTNQGQICLCGSRILVEQSIYDRFLSDFIRETALLKVGDPLEESTQVGAIVSKAQWEKDLAYLEIAKQEGGKIIQGGTIPSVNERCKNGWFLAPTIITHLEAYCRVNQEEIFGPIVTIQPFSSEEEAIRLANSTEYGLAATVWTTNLQRTMRVSAALESGIVWVNNWLIRDLRTPFGGVKNSGVGREGGTEVLKFFTEPKNVFIQY